MKPVAIAARRTILGPPTVVVRASVALGDSLVVLTGVGLWLWLLINLLSTAASGMM